MRKYRTIIKKVPPRKVSVGRGEVLLIEPVHVFQESEPAWLEWGDHAWVVPFSQLLAEGFKAMQTVKGIPEAKFYPMTRQAGGGYVLPPRAIDWCEKHQANEAVGKGWAINFIATTESWFNAYRVNAKPRKPVKQTQDLLTRYFAEYISCPWKPSND